MRILRLILIFLLIGLPSTSWADIDPGDLPSTSKWYFHANFEEMRSTEGGLQLYAWLQDEAFEDIREDVGIDFDKEVDQITGYAASEDGLVIVIEGDISQSTKDKILGMGAATGNLDKLGSGDATYFFVKGDRHSDDDYDSDDHSDLDSLENGAYFSFAIPDRIIVTTTETMLKTLLATKGKIPGDKGQSGALVVLSADRNLVQAGMSTDDFQDHLGWNSNIIGNTEQVALLIADEGGKIMIEAQLVTAEKEMAESLASIVRGLISLQIFNDDMDPEIAEFLQNTSVRVDGTKLTIKVLLDPESVIAALD